MSTPKKPAQKALKETLASDEQPVGVVEGEREVESAVNDPHAQREDDVARERSTSPVPRVGDTWEQIHTDRWRNGPQRRVGVLSIDGDEVLVVDKVTRGESTIRIDRFAPPDWRFIG